MIEANVHDCAKLGNEKLIVPKRHDLPKVFRNLYVLFAIEKMFEIIDRKYI